jgi:hypothetical protein
LGFPCPQGANHACRAGFATAGRIKYLFMEIAFLSCHVSIKKKSARKSRATVKWFSPLRERDLRKLRQKLRHKFALPFL